MSGWLGWDFAKPRRQRRFFGCLFHFSRFDFTWLVKLLYHLQPFGNLFCRLRLWSAWRLS